MHCDDKDFFFMNSLTCRLCPVLTVSIFIWFSFHSYERFNIFKFLEKCWGGQRTPLAIFPSSSFYLQHLSTGWLDHKHGYDLPSSFVNCTLQLWEGKRNGIRRIKMKQDLRWNLMHRRVPYWDMVALWRNCHYIKDLPIWLLFLTPRNKKKTFFEKWSLQLAGSWVTSDETLGKFADFGRKAEFTHSWKKTFWIKMYKCTRTGRNWCSWTIF